MENKNSIIITIIVALLVGLVTFYGGMQYQKSQLINFAGRNGNQTGMMQGRAFGNALGTRPISGEIISQDDASITVKMQDGSTKIIILSDKTTINKASAGIKSDLKTGERITVFGTANSDGSVTAQNVSIGQMMRGIPIPSPTK